MLKSPFSLIMAILSSKVMCSWWLSCSFVRPCWPPTLTSALVLMSGMLSSLCSFLGMPLALLLAAPFPMDFFGIALVDALPLGAMALNTQEARLGGGGGAWPYLTQSSGLVASFAGMSYYYVTCLLISLAMFQASSQDNELPCGMFTQCIGNVPSQLPRH